MRVWLVALIICILLSFPFTSGENLSLIIDTPRGIEVQNLSENATTNFSDFLDKDVGIYYEVIADEPDNYTKDFGTNFSDDNNVVRIDDGDLEFGSVYVNIDDLRSNTTTSPTDYVLFENQTLAVVQQGDVSISFGEIEQLPITDGENVKWTQLIEMTNAGDAREVTLNLWSHDDILNRSFLWDVVKAQMTINNDIISQTPIGIIPLKKGETKRVFVTFETPAVTVDRNCYDVTVQDLLPSDATILESTIDLDTIVESMCIVRIEYPDNARYREVAFIE